MSMLTMNSRPSIAAARRRPLGADSTGLLAMAISAFTWPGPAVSISSARQFIGISPKTSGALLTRLVQRPVMTPRPEPGVPAGVAAEAAALGDTAPPRAAGGAGR